MSVASLLTSRNHLGEGIPKDLRAMRNASGGNHFGWIVVAV